MTEPSQFDADAFMNSVTTEDNATRLPLCPPGEYPGQITKVEFKQGVIKNGERIGEAWYQLALAVETSDPAALDGLDLPKRTVRGSIMLDLTPTGGIATGDGRNVALGRLREAVGLNQKGEPFSPNMLVGRACRFVVGHRVDDRDASKVYEDIRAWRPL